MAFLFRDQDHHDDDVAAALQGREHEWANYELNRLNYEAVLAGDDVKSLPEVWPDTLVQYKAIVGEKLASMGLSAEDYAAITALQFRDRVRLLLATTMTEQAKTLQMYNVLAATITDEARLQAAIARVKARRNGGG